MNLIKKDNINYYLIDYIKLLSAILIVGSHCLPIFGIEILDLYYGQWFFRFCVPFFFISMGFFLNKGILNNNFIFKYKIKSLIKLYIISTLLYLPIIIYNNYSLDELIYNLIFGFSHLWFIVSSIIGILLLWLFVKLRNKYCMIIPITIYIIGAFINSYIPLINQELSLSINNLIYYIGTARNGLFFAFPLITIGYIIKNNISKIKSIAFFKILILFLLSIVLSFCESMYIENNMFLTLDLTLFMPIVSILLFVICIKLSLSRNEYNSNNEINREIKDTKIIRQLSLNIYIIHYLIIIIFDLIFEFLNIKILPIIRYILITIITLLLSMLVLKINNKLSNLRKSKKEFKKVTN